MSAFVDTVPEFDGFFSSAREGRLCFPKCDDCGKFHWYPMPRCPHCRSKNISWQEVSSRGEIFSFTSVQHPFNKERAADLPFLVGLISFADAPDVRLVTNIIDADYADLRIGQAVEAIFPHPDDDPAAVLFRPVGDA
jgi:uncharacterized OB-fold protein